MIEKNIGRLDDIIDLSSLLSRDNLIEILTNDDKRFQVSMKISNDIQNLLRENIGIIDIPSTTTDTLVDKVILETLQNQLQTLNSLLLLINLMREDKRKDLADGLRERVKNE